MAMWMLIYGNFAGGVTDAIGPFKSEEAAEEWHLSQSPWRSVTSGLSGVVVELRLPENAVATMADA